MINTQTKFNIMKRSILLTAILLAMTTLASAQHHDWAFFSRYADANAKVTTTPKAVIMGDSITEGWFEKRAEFFTDNNIQGRGISGQTSSHMLVRFRRDVIDLDPKYVVILAGTNDIALNNGKISLENIFGNIVSMCELAKANKIKPIIASVLPCSYYPWRPEVKDPAGQIIKLNGMLQEYAQKNKIRYIDFHSILKDEKNGLPENHAKDGVHPGADCYKIMEEMVLKELR